MIELSQQQLNAVNTIVDFITAPYPKNANKDAITCSLVGSAGVGKTTVVNKVLEKLNNRVKTMLLAPTHKAANVLATVSGKEAITLHSLLGLRPDLSLENFDARWIKYRRKFPKESMDSTFIIDEASMINNELFSYLLELARENRCKILFISDSAQLKPVRSKHKSKVYSCKNTIVLDKVFRQADDNPLMPVLNFLREKSIPLFKSRYNEHGGLAVCPRQDIFIEKAVKGFKTTNNIKVLAYTNDAVASYNQEIFKKLFPDSDSPFPVGCLLTGYNNIKRGKMEIITNSMDYIVIDSKRNNKVYVKITGNEDKLNVSGWSLTVRKMINGKEVPNSDKNIFIGDIDNDLSLILGQELEARRERSIDNNDWNSFYSLQNNLLTTRAWAFRGRVINTRNIDYGYAMTVHKSQSSTYDTVFVDMKDINTHTIKREQDRQQLQYVALSRTRKFAYVLWY